MAKKLIIGNWKMNPASWKEARKIVDKVRSRAKRYKNVTAVFCPPHPFLGLALLCDTNFGAQDVFYEKEGAYTGEVSVRMLKNFGISYVIVGHSERRALGDTLLDINKKTKAALAAGIIPILCVGERERDSHSHYLQIIKEELRSALKGVPRNKISKIVIAYEPVWAVGKRALGVLDAEEALHMNIFIRKTIADVAGDATAKKIKVLYGGSVEAKNTKDFISIGKMDGLLVGRQSLKPSTFLEIIKNANDI